MTPNLQMFLQSHNIFTLCTILHKEKNKLHKEEIISLTSFLNNNATMSERIFCLNNNITDLIKCQCGKRLNLKLMD